MSMFRNVSVYVMLIVFGAGRVWAESNVWTSLGPYGGAIKTLAIDPKNTNTMYAGTFAGIFKTENAGASWGAANAGLPSGLPGTLVIDPQNTSTLYATTLSGGLFKSTDAALSWSAVPLLDQLYIQTIAIDPQLPDTVYAGGVVYVDPGPPTYSTILKTTDGGATWGAVPLPRHLYVRIMAIDPQNSNTMYAGGIVYAGDPGTVYTAVFKTTDGGASWGASSGLPSRVDGFHGWLGISHLVVDPQNPSTLYVGALEGGVFKSTDGGASWSAVNSGFPADFTRTLGLAIDPGIPGAIYAAMSFSPETIELLQGGCCRHPGAVFKSTDGAVSWSQIHSGLPGDAFDSIVDGDLGPMNVGLAVDSQTPGVVYVGTNDAGVFKSTDGGVRWSVANSGLAAIPIDKPILDPKAPGAIYAAGWSRIYKSTDSGMNWSAGDWGVPALYAGLVIDQQTPSTMYAGGGSQQDGFFLGGVFKSMDGGRSWRDANSRAVRGLCCIETLVIDPHNSDTVYAGTDDGVIKTTDGGGTWSTASTGVPMGVLTEHPPVYSIVIDPQNPTTIYAAGNRAISAGPIFKSTDGGASWNAASFGVPAAFSINWLTIDPQNPSTVYGWGGNGYEAGPRRSRLFRTTDGGTSWNEFNFGLPADAIASLLPLVFDPQDPGKIYAGNTKGVLFGSTDGGTNWSLLSSGLPGLFARSLTIDPTNPTMLYAGTNGGVFAITLAP